MRILSALLLYSITFKYIMHFQLCATAQHWANLLAHKNEFFYQNPPDLGENLFAWNPPIAQLSVNLSIMKKKPDVSGEDAAIYWYKSHSHYDYEKEPNVLHAHAGIPISPSQIYTYLTCLNTFL